MIWNDAVHTSALLLKFQNRQGMSEQGDPSCEETLQLFARRLGMTVQELELELSREQLAHDARACTLPGCLAEFSRPPKTPRPHTIPPVRRKVDKSPAMCLIPADTADLPVEPCRFFWGTSIREPCARCGQPYAKHRH